MQPIAPKSLNGFDSFSHDGAATPASSVSCSICGRPVSSSFSVHGYRLFTCLRCDFAFIDPSAAAKYDSTVVFDDGYFHGGGAGYANYLDEAHLLQEHGRRYGELLSKVGAHHVLDVGAAAGFIMRGLQEAGCDGVGIEPNASMAAFAMRELALNMQATTLERFGYNGQFDAVVMLQVVDHLEDIRLSFRRVVELTKPGGWCLIEFGDRGSWTARLLGAAWHEYAPPSVQRVFSLHALRLLLSDYGFALHSCGHPKKYLRGDHAVALLRFKAGPRLGNKLAGPLARLIPARAKLRYFGDDITWALFQRR